MYQFEENSRVCFFGDSITYEAHWIRRVYSYYRNVLGKRFEIYNCGVPGSTATGGLGRMDEALLNYNPTDVVIMFGMNDVGDTYAEGALDDGKIIERRFRMDGCISSLKKIASELSERGIRIIFCTPTPYDELADCDEPCRLGVSAALCELGGRIKDLAKSFGGHIVDFNTEFYSAMKQHYKEDFSMIRTDRTHPNVFGYEFMSRVFLKAQGFDVEIVKEKNKLIECSKIGFDNWEEERFKLERAAKKYDFVEWALYPTIKDRDVIKKRVKEYPTKSANDYIEMCLKVYLESEDKTLEETEKLIQYTKTVYSV